MALKTCKECKKEVSTEAKACPHCGATWPTGKPTGCVTYVVGGFVVMMALGALISALSPSPAPSGATPNPSGSSATMSAFDAPPPFTLTRKGYVVKGSSHRFDSGEIDIELYMVFKKRPTPEKTYSILSSEVVEYVRKIGGPPKVEVMATAYVGNPDEGLDSWEQLRDPAHSYYISARYDARTNSIMKGKLTEGEPIVSNVLSGAQAETAAAVAKVGDEERAKEHEKNKLITAAAAAQRLLRQVRDPDSLKIESVLITDKDGFACIEYRAKNGFGGMNRESAVFIGLALITPADKEFVTAWNRWCANKTGTEEVTYVSRLIEQGVIK